MRLPIGTALEKRANWTSVAPIAFLLLWSNGFIFLKLGLEYADPFTFLALRYALVSAVLAVIVVWRRPTFPTTLREWAPIIAVGLFLQTGYFAFTYLSLYSGLSAGIVALITCQQPILIGLASPLITKEKVSFKQWVGLSLGVAGASIVITSNAHSSIISGTGLLFALFALLSITGGTLVEKRYSASSNPITANFIQYTVALFITAPLAYALEPMQVEWSIELLISLLYLVFGASILAISLLLAMIRKGQAARVSALFFLVPPTTTLIAFMFLDEPLSLQSIAGITMTAVAIYIVMKHKTKSA